MNRVDLQRIYKLESNISRHYKQNSFTKMIKKKDRLLEVLKNKEKYPLTEFLTAHDLISLALVKKSYFMQILPQIKLRQLDAVVTNGKKRPQGTMSKNKKAKEAKKQQISSDSDSFESTEFKIEKFNINKWPKDVTYGVKNWLRIDKLPFSNGFLQKKLQSKCYIFFKNKETKDLLYLNRSILDPTLDFQKGSFNDQLDQDIYEHMYQESEVELDFTSRQMLLKRQKEMLQKINKRKNEILEKDNVSYEKELQKAANMKRYAIILCFGGSFSLAIYQKSKCIIHQSDKKYVCRKKAGERQWNRDKQSGSSIKSMGSQIRRDQQKKHIINVNFILNENREELFKCQLIFLQAPGMNRLYIINENQTMAQLQRKLRSVCLTAKKANFTEVQLINENINNVHLVKVSTSQKSIN